MIPHPQAHLHYIRINSLHWLSLTIWKMLSAKFISSDAQSLKLESLVTLSGGLIWNVKPFFITMYKKKILNWSRRAVASLRFQFHFCSVTIPSHAALIQNIHSSTVFPFLLSNSFCKVEVSLFSLSSSILNGFSYWTSLTCNNGCGQNFWCFPMHFISISNGTETYNVK